MSEWLHGRVVGDTAGIAGNALGLVAAVIALSCRSYRKHGTDWWDYLDQIENALETAAPLSEDVVPALLLLPRRKRVLSK